MLSQLSERKLSELVHVAGYLKRDIDFDFLREAGRGGLAKVMPLALPSHELPNLRIDILRIRMGTAMEGPP